MVRPLDAALAAISVADTHSRESQLMRIALGLLLGLTATTAAATTDPRTVPTKLDPAWQAKTRAFFSELIEIPSVVGRGQVPQVAEAIGAQLRAAGFPASDMQILPYEGLPGDQTAAFYFRWKAEHATKKPMMIIGHMDVVEAKREDWTFDPFKFREENGYFLGRGTMDMKNGLVATTMALIKLKQAGFRPNRDIILFFTGDEETKQNGALFGTTKWRNLLDPEFGLNADGASGSYERNFSVRPFGLGAAEKVYQTYFFTVHNPGGHSSRPRPDNAIYELADALKKLQAHRFTPQLNPTTRAYFSARAKQEGNSPLGQAIQRWLANENDGEAADVIEASESEVGLTRTRCVATMLEAGHADNALPQSATATVNCRMMPGTQPPTIQAQLQNVVGPKVEIKPDPSFIGQPTPVLPLRDDVTAAFTHAVRAIHGQNTPIIPMMGTGTSDSSFFRAIGIPTYDVDGSWGIKPDDEREHGLDERVPVRAMYDDVLHWEMMIRDLAS
jgi:acetylornithine deacetylase/succinyl-diaminopimelate desuccinylase-like protein